MLNNAIRLLLLALSSLLVLSACTREPFGPEDPKRRLTDYISMSFNIKAASDKPALLEFLTGETRTRLEAWSDEQFKQAFVDTKKQFQRLVILEMKSMNPTEASITYEVTYLDQGKGHDARVTNKKLAILSQEKSRWFIKDVRNIKELVEYRNEMALP